MTVIQLKRRFPRDPLRCAQKILDHALSERIITLAFIAVTHEGFVCDVCGTAPVTDDMLTVLDAKAAKFRPG